MTEEEIERIRQSAFLSGYNTRAKELENQLTEKDKQIAELTEENENLQQKYLSESYEKSKLVSENNRLLDVINNQDVKIADLESQIKVLEQNIEDTEICEKALKERNKHLDAALTGKALISNERKEQLEQANQLIKDYLRIANCVIADKPEFEKLTKKAKRFLKGAGKC